MRTMRRHIIRALVALFLLTGVVAVFYSPTAVWTSPLCAFFPTSDRCIQGVPDVVNVLDYGATPFYGNSGDTTSDDTVAFQRAIDALPAPFMTFSSGFHLGGIVYIPAGKYRIGTAGQMGRCSGGSASGTPCDEVSDCPGGPPTNATPYCAWLTSHGRPLHLIGAGPEATEIGVMHGGAAGKLGEVSAVALDPGDQFGSIENLRLIKIQSQKTPAFYPSATSHVANGIIIRAARTLVYNITIEAFGGHGILLDGELGVANANSCRFDKIFTGQNGGDGMRIWSRGAGGILGPGDGSSHNFTMIDSQGNDGWGLWLRSSKNDAAMLEFNNNALGAINVSGTNNKLAAYFEVDAHPCIKFDNADGATPNYNRVFDLSGCTENQSLLSDSGLRNWVSVQGGFTRLGLQPMRAGLLQTCSAGEFFLFVDDALDVIRRCENGTITDVNGSNKTNVATTDATVTTLQSLVLGSGTTYLVETHVYARRTGGAAGSAEDGAGYVIRATYKMVAGTATLIGAVNADYTAESQAGWDATLAAAVAGGCAANSAICVRVTGAVNNDVSWRAEMFARKP